MRDKDCVRFLQWCLPKLGLRWRGFRKVRRTVCKRVTRRMRELGLADVADYQSYLADHPGEWERLNEYCRIPISRFWRDRTVYRWLADEALPALAGEAARRGDQVVRCWSAGCASGEEPYSVRIAWAHRADVAHPDVPIEIIATDVEPAMISRTHAARYSEGSLRSLPEKWKEDCFDRDGQEFVLKPEFRDGVITRLQDLQKAWPEGPFDLILCRNSAFTYFDERVQREILDRLVERLRPGGLLIIGGHETLLENGWPLSPVQEGLPVYRRGAT